MGTSKNATDCDSMIMEGKEIQHIAAYSHIQLLDTPITDTSHLSERNCQDMFNQNN